MENNREPSFQKFLESIQKQNGVVDKPTPSEGVLERIAASIERIEKNLIGVQQNVVVNALEKEKNEEGELSRRLSVPVGEQLSGQGKPLDLMSGISDKFKNIFNLVTGSVVKKDQNTNPGVVGKNPEADNVQDSQEIMADASKQDVELTKETNKLLKEQLSELKQIREALAPKVPSELPGGKTVGAFAGMAGEDVEGGSGGIGIPPIVPIGGGKGKPVPGGGKDGKKPGKGTSKGPGKTPSKVPGIAASFLKKAGILGAIFTLFDAGISAIDAKEVLDLEGDQEPSIGDRVAAAVGAVTESATFGLADKKEIAKILAETPEGKKLAEKNRKELEGVSVGDVGEFAGVSTDNIVTPVETTPEERDRIREKNSKAISGVGVGDVGEFAGFNLDLHAPAPVESVTPVAPVNSNAMSIKILKDPSRTENEGRVFQVNRNSMSTIISPDRRSATGPIVSQTSIENADMAREAARQAPAVQPIISNNVSNNNTTSYVPIKPSPRPERSGSALDRYNDRVTAY